MNALRSGVVTGLSTATVSASAAVAGALLARELGRGVETDGFFAAYAVYLALVLVASALRVVVLPRFAEILSELGQSPPATTRAVLMTSGWLRVGAIPLLLVILLGLVAWRSWTNTAEGRR